jgi:hypothetical protein
MKNVCPNWPRLKEGGIPLNPNLGKVVNTNCVTLQTNPWGEDENTREPIVVVTTKSQLWAREGVLVSTHNGHPPIPPIILTRWREDQKLILEMMTFYQQLQEGIGE